MTWTDGVTQGGSSGSGLFDAETGKVVAVLSGVLLRMIAPAGWSMRKLMMSLRGLLGARQCWQVVVAGPPFLPGAGAGGQSSCGSDDKTGEQLSWHIAWQLAGRLAAELAHGGMLRSWREAGAGSLCLPAASAAPAAQRSSATAQQLGSHRGAHLPRPCVQITMAGWPPPGAAAWPTT